MKTWFRLLRLGFQQLGYKYYYAISMIPKILREAIEVESKKGSEAEEESYRKAAREEFERREKERCEAREAISKQMTVRDLLRRHDQPPKEEQQSVGNESV